jgi:hypothetical protein
VVRVWRGLLWRVLLSAILITAVLVGFREWNARAAQLVFVPVPKGDIPAGTLLSALTHMDAVEVPIRLVTSDVVQSPDEVNGKYAVTTLFAGLPISKKALSLKSPESSIYSLPPGHVAFPLIVDRRSLLASATFVKKDALIDLVVVVGASEKEKTEWLLARPDQPPARPLITKVKVMDVVSKGNSLVWILDLTHEQAISMAAIDAQAYNVYAILTEPENKDLDAILGKGGEER